MTVANAFHYLLEHTFGFSLWESFVWVCFEITMERATRDILHHYNNILASVNHFVESNYVLASHFLHQFNLSPYRFSSIWVHQFVFLIDFHSYFFVCWFVKANAHDRISALTDLFTNYVVIEYCLVAEDHAIIRIRLSNFFNWFLR